jgi:hypothetical protein
VGNHKTAYALSGQFAERKQLNAVQSRSVVQDEGQVQMRVHIGIAVAGKVFGASHHAVVLHAFGVHIAFDGYIVAVFAERTGVDDGVGGVVVHIGNGGKIDVNADAAALAGHFFAEFVDEPVVLNGAQRQLPGIADGVFFEAHAEAPFAVYGYHERYVPGECLIAIGEFYLLLACPEKSTALLHGIR